MNGPGNDSVFRIEAFLHLPSATRFRQGLFQAFRHRVGKEDHRAVDVSAGASHRLDQAPVIPQEAFLVRIENRHQGNFRKIQPLAKQVDSDKNVEISLAKPAQELVTFQRLDFAVQIARLDIDRNQEVRQVLGHLLCQGRHQDAFAPSRHLRDAPEQDVHLPLDRIQFDFRVEKPGRTVDLLDNDSAGLFQFVVSGSRAHEEDLVRIDRLEFVEIHRAVVERARQAEPVLHEIRLARPVSLGHAAYLRNARMAFVNHQEPVVAKIVEQRKRPRTGHSLFHDPRIVLDTRTDSRRPDHFHVVAGTAFEARTRKNARIRFGNVSRLAKRRLFLRQLFEPCGKLPFDILRDAFPGIFARHKMPCRSDADIFQLFFRVSRQEVESTDAVHLVAKELDADSHVVIARIDFDHVTADSERSAFERKVVPLVLNVHELHQDLVAFPNLSHLQADHQFKVFLRRTQPVNAAHARHDNRIAPRQEIRSRPQAQLVDFVVDRSVLFDIRIRVDNVGFGLVVVVIADEIFDGVVGKERLEFLVELGCERLVVRENERRLSHVPNDIRHGERLSGARHAEKALEAFSPFEPFRKFPDGFGLVACRRVVAVQFELGACRFQELRKRPRLALFGRKPCEKRFLIRIRTD